jgi:hypothetical protein
MKIIKVLIICLFLVTSSDVSSQTNNTPAFQYTGNEFSPGINKFVAKHNSLNLYMTNYLLERYPNWRDSLCNTTVGFIKFRISDSGKINDVSCSKTFRRFVSQVLKEALQKSEPYWVLPGKTQTKWILQPVMYNCHLCEEIPDDSRCETERMFVFDDSSMLDWQEFLILDPWLSSAVACDFDSPSAPDKN